MSLCCAACCAAEGACCAAETGCCLASSLCCCGGRDAVDSKNSKYIYLVAFVLSSIAQWVLRDYSDQFGLSITGCSSSSSGLCWGKEAVLRISLGSTFFFALLCLLTLGVRRSGEARLRLHNGFWLVKVLLYPGAIVGSFYVPEWAVAKYGETARILAGIYLVIQVQSYIDNPLLGFCGFIFSPVLDATRGAAC